MRSDDPTHLSQSKRQRISNEKGEETADEEYKYMDNSPLFWNMVKSGLVKGENGSLQLIPAKKHLCCEDSDSSFFFSQTPVNKLSNPYICWVME